MFVGQVQIVEKVDNLTLENFNCPLLFLGPIGCGKKTLAKYLSERLGIDFVLIDEKITAEETIEINQDPIKKLYYIDLDKFLEKQQNQFLKFIEEHSKNVYLILGAESEAFILETILNRCIKYKFNEYSALELEKITGKNSDFIYRIFKTPGQILSIDENQLKELYQFCKYFIENYYKVEMTTSRLLRSSTKINYKEEYNKYDFDNFFTVLNYIAVEDYYKNKTEKSLELYLFTNKYLSNFRKAVLSKENFMLNYLISLKESVR